jgi:hypothetical protein
MKMPITWGSLLLLALLVTPDGHGARHQHPYACLVRSYPARPAPLRPPRIVRTPAVARQHRQVRAVRRVPGPTLRRLSS